MSLYEWWPKDRPEPGRAWTKVRPEWRVSLLDGIGDGCGEALLLGFLALVALPFLALFGAGVEDALVLVVLGVAALAVLAGSAAAYHWWERTIGQRPPRWRRGLYVRHDAVAVARPRWPAAVIPWADLRRVAMEASQEPDADPGRDVLVLVGADGRTEVPWIARTAWPAWAVDEALRSEDHREQDRGLRQRAYDVLVERLVRWRDEATAAEAGG